MQTLVPEKKRFSPWAVVWWAYNNKLLSATFCWSALAGATIAATITSFVIFPLLIILSAISGVMLLILWSMRFADWWEFDDGRWKVEEFLESKVKIKD